MSKTVNNVEKTIVDADKVAKALTEGTQTQFQKIMEEALTNLIKEEEEREESEDNDSEVEGAESKETEDNSYDVEDIDADGTDENDDNEDENPDDNEGGEDGAEDEWSDLDSYRMNDGNDYDFTGADGDTVLNVYNKLDDSDEIIVTKDEDGNYEFEDEGTGTEYVIELNPEGEAADEMEGDDEEGIELELDLEGNDEEEGEDDDLEIGDETEDEGEGLELDIDLDDEEDGNEEGIELELDDEEDTDELNEENLGYTMNYQKDVFKGGLKMGSNKRPNTNDWDEGAPDGSKRPYGKRGSDAPYTENVNECGTVGECGDANMEETMTLRKSYKTKRVNKAPKGHEAYANMFPEEKKESLDEAKVRRMYESAKKILAENKIYKENNEKLSEAVNSIKKSLYEAAVLNMNLGKIVNLLVNETTTKAEKMDILESFNAVKTVKEGEKLYESYKKKLSGKTEKTAIMERTISMSNPSLNETTIYTQKNPSLELMERMDNLFRK